MSWSEIGFKQHCSYHICLIIAAHDPLVTATALAERDSPFKLVSVALFHFLDSKQSPWGPVKAGTIDSFHILVGKVTGLQSSFVFYGRRGRARAVCRAGAAIQRGWERGQTDPTSANQTHPMFTWTHLLAADSTSGLCFQPSACFVCLITCMTSERHALATCKMDFIGKFLVLSIRNSLFFSYYHI